MKETNYIVYRIVIDPSLVDAAQALLAVDIEMDGVSYEEDGFSLYVDQDVDESFIQNHLLKLQSTFPFTFEKSQLEHRNWNAEWESDFKSVEVRDYCRVRAPFHDPSDAFQYDIIVHPGMAFGTGHHETTWQMIDNISKIPLKGLKVLDAGCGTSVLAILAAKVGASHIDAFDYDIHSVESSELNKELNNVRHINVSQSDVSNYVGENYDLILANINRNVILSSMPSFYKKLAYNGMIIVSGYLESDIDLIQNAASSTGLKLTSTNQRGEWMCQVFQKK